MVTSLNYNLFSKEERANAKRELKAYLQGKSEYKAKIFIPDEEGGGSWKTIIRRVNTQ